MKFENFINVVLFHFVCPSMRKLLKNSTHHRRSAYIGFDLSTHPKKREKKSLLYYRAFFYSPLCKQIYEFEAFVKLVCICIYLVRQPRG